MKRFIAMAGIAIIISTATSCSDDTPAVEYKSQGFIKGSVSGTLSDDETSFSEEFKFTQYSPALMDGEPASAYYVDEDDGSIEVAIGRQSFKDGSYMSLHFEMEDENDTTPEDVYIYSVVVKEEKEQIFLFYMNSYEDEGEISNISFDMESGKMSGSFSVDGNTNNSTGNEATLSGTFEVMLKKYYQ